MNWNYGRDFRVTFEIVRKFKVRGCMLIFLLGPSSLNFCAFYLLLLCLILLFPKGYHIRTESQSE